MAALSKIKAGTKMYHSKGGNTRDKFARRRVPVISVIYVLEVDTDNKKVLGSINGMPAVWFDRMKYGRWKLDNPLKKAV